MKVSLNVPVKSPRLGDTAFKVAGMGVYWMMRHVIKWQKGRASSRD